MFEYPFKVLNILGKKHSIADPKFLIKFSEYLMLIAIPIISSELS